MNRVAAARGGGCRWRGHRGCLCGEDVGTARGRAPELPPVTAES